MSDRAFVDTNVLVYVYSSTEPDKQVLARKLGEQFEMVVSTQVLNELCNVLLRKFRIPVAGIQNAIDEIRAAADVVLLTPDTTSEALRLIERYRYSFFDSLIIASALAANVTRLFSEDLQHGQRIEKTLLIRSPFRALSER